MKSISIKETLHLDKLRSGDIPAGASALVGIIVLLIAVKTGKRMLKFLLIVAAVLFLLLAIWLDLGNR
jgi:hypothetical protein